LTEKSAQIWVFPATRDGDGNALVNISRCYKVRGSQFYETVCVGACYALAA